MSAPSFLTHGSRPLILGHRGASAHFPENTLLALRESLRAGADGVELDVMRCASGEVVVVHDDDLARVANQVTGSELMVRHSTLTELRRFDLGRGELIPTLAEVCEELGPQALINVELKSPEPRRRREHLNLLHDDGLAQAVLQVLERVGRHPDRNARTSDARETTLVSSFDPLQLRRFWACTPSLPLGYLFHHDQGPVMRNLWRSLLPMLRAVHPQASLIDAVSMRTWRAAGLSVNTWTVDNPHEVAALCALGIDAIITNTPATVLHQLTTT